MIKELVILKTASYMGTYRLYIYRYIYIYLFLQPCWATPLPHSIPLVLQLEKASPHHPPGFLSWEKPPHSIPLVFSVEKAPHSILLVFSGGKKPPNIIPLVLQLEKASSQHPPGKSLSQLSACRKIPTCSTPSPSNPFMVFVPGSSCPSCSLPSL